MIIKRINKFCFIGLACFLFASLASYAQLNCKITHYSTENGLSHDKISCMTKDKEGFMWFGTWDGLNRFDGQHFITFKSRAGDSSGLKNNRIDQIAEDANGYLWLKANDNSIYRFDKKKNIFIELSKLLKNETLGKLLFERIFISSDGTLWVQTKGSGVLAIVNPDGAHPTCNLFAKDSQGAFHLPDNHFLFFKEDRRQQIWVGVPNGLVLLTKNPENKYKVTEIPGWLGNFNFTGLAENNSEVVFTTKQGYLVSFDKRTKKIEKFEISPGSQLNAICLSANQNTAYCTTSSGELLILNATDFGKKATIRLSNDPVFSIYEDRRGLVWVEPKIHGILKYDPVKNSSKFFSQKNYSDFPNGSEYYRVSEDSKGNLWANMKGGGFGYYDAKADTIAHFFNDPDLKDYRFCNKVNYQYFDRAGVFWISTEDKGVEKAVVVENNFIQQALVPKSLIRSDNEIRAVYSDREKRLWIASKHKLYLFLNNKAISYNFINEPVAGIKQIYAIFEDKAGRMWFGTKGNGLYKAEPVDANNNSYRITQYLPIANDPYSISSNMIYSITEDNNGEIWLATIDGGINQVAIKNGQAKFFNLKNTFKNISQQYIKVRTVIKDANGFIWAGTTGGLLVIDPSHGQPGQYRTAAYSKIPGDTTSLGNNDILYIYEDSFKNKWLCTAGGGLNRAVGNNPFSKLKFKEFTMASGLPNDFILSCVEDQYKNLWIATQKGLSKFSLRDHHYTNYDSYNGLPAGGFSESTCTVLSDGKMVFGKLNGYLSFNPVNIVNPKIEVPMVFINFQVGGKDFDALKNEHAVVGSDVNYNSTIRLKYNENMIGIYYTVLDYRSNYKRAYVYRLLGLDTNWTKNDVGQQQATYANLAPGTYEFQVKSINSGLYKNIPARNLYIVIDPPFWRTWWAYLFYLAIVITAVIFIRRIVITMLKLRQRVAVEKKLADLKIDFFTQISHELRTPLTLILNPIDEIVQKERMSKKGMDCALLIQKNANRMVRFINQLLDLRKAQSGKAALHVSEIEIVSFVKNITGYFSEVCYEKNIKLSVVAAFPERYVWIDAERIDIIIYNLLSNAFKFTSEGKAITIKIDVDLKTEFLIIKVIDQGIGVPEEQLSNIFELYYEGEHSDSLKYLKGTGIGLSLSKELITLHHGEITALNNSDGGLTVSIRIKLGKEHFKAGEVVFVDQPSIQLLRGPIITATHENITEVLPLVLLVEDNQDLRAFLASQLSELYRVSEAENGQAGFEKAIELSPDLILSDIMMPVMDGIRLLDKLKHTTETSHIPVILLSAKMSVETQIQGLKYGADCYITKPFNNEFLLAAVANLLQQRKNLFKGIVNEKCRLKLEPGEVIITNKDEIFLREVIQVVEKEMTDSEFNIDGFAASIGMSRSAFYKKFKSLTSLSPVEFVRDMRLKRGKQLMDCGEDNISQIAYAIGFSDPKYFSSCFKKEHLLSPSEYLRTGLLRTVHKESTNID